MKLGQWRGVQGYDALLKAGIQNRPAYKEAGHDHENDMARDSLLFVNLVPGRGNSDVKCSTSPLHEQNGLSDEATWNRGIGNRFGKAANQGDLYRAITGAIGEYETSLEAKLGSKREAAEQLSRKADLSVEAAAERFAHLNSTLREFQRNNPGKNGDIARPDLSDLQSSLADAQDAAQDGRFQQALSLAMNVKGVSDDHLARLDKYEQDDASMKELSSTLSSLGDSRWGHAAKEQVSAAGVLLAQADREWQLADSSYIASLREASTNITSVKKLVNSELPLAAETLSEMTEELDDLMGRKRSGSASDELVSAREAVTVALDSLEGTDSDFREKVRDAVDAVTEVKKEIDGADVAAAFRNLLLGVLAGGAIGATGLANLRARRGRTEAEEILEQRKEELSNSREALKGMYDLVSEFVDPDTGRVNYTGKTKVKLEEAIKKADGLWQMQAKAQQIVEQAEALINGADGGWIKNQLSKSNFDLAIELLSNQDIQIDPNEGVTRALGKVEPSKEDSLFAKLRRSTEPVTTSFLEIQERFESEGREAESIFKAVQAAAGSVSKAIEEADDRLGDLSSRYEEYAESFEDDRQHLALANFADEAVVQLDGRLGSALSSTLLDPLSAQGELEDINPRIARLSDVLEISSELADVNNEHGLQPLRVKREELLEERILTEWIGGRVENLYSDVNNYLAALPTSNLDALGEPRDMKGALSNLISEANMALEIEKDREANINRRAVDLTENVIEARKRYARTLKERFPKETFRPEDMLTEEFEGENRNPDQILDQVIKLSTVCEQSLMDGNLEQAAMAQRQAHAALAQVEKILELTQASLATHDETLESMFKKGELLESYAEEHVKILRQLQENFDDAVLSLRAGDPTHPNANGTINDNIEEIGNAIREREDIVENVEKLFEQGRFLEAGHERERAIAANDFIEHRFNEIAQKQESVLGAVAANTEFLDAYRSELEELEALINDRKVMQPTISLYKESKALLESLQMDHEAERSNPFEIQDRLKDVRDGIAHIYNQIESDKQEYEEACRSCEAVEQAYALASKAYKSASEDGDEIGDSVKIKLSLASLRVIKREIENLKKDLENDHGDWDAIDDRADRFTSEAANLARDLRKEEALGDNVARAIESASGSVRNARRWSGSYGVSIHGAPGKSALRDAREWLAKGDYRRAEEAASRAQRKSRNAVSQAKAKVTRLRREEEDRQRRAAAARRRRERQRRSYSSSNSSSFGSSFSSGSSGSSFGGGFSSGSSGSSGSSF